MATIKARLEPTGEVRILTGEGEIVVEPRTDWSFLDATSEEDIAEQERTDDEDDAVRDAALLQALDEIESKGTL
jgi:hypothetical protein